MFTRLGILWWSEPSDAESIQLQLATLKHFITHVLTRTWAVPTNSTLSTSLRVYLYVVHDQLMDRQQTLRSMSCYDVTKRDQLTFVSKSNAAWHYANPIVSQNEEEEGAYWEILEQKAEKWWRKFRCILNKKSRRQPLQMPADRIDWTRQLSKGHELSIQHIFWADAPKEIYLSGWKWHKQSLSAWGM